MELDEINIFSNLNQNNNFLEFYEEEESSFYNNSCQNHCGSNTRSVNDSINSFRNEELNVEGFSNDYQKNSAEEGKKFFLFF